MRHEPNDNWPDLFRAARGDEPAVHLQWRVLKKGGQPFLILPDNAKLAVASLNLYPAQTAFARAGKTLLRLLLQTGVTAVGRKARLAIPKDDELLRFLAGLTDSPISQLPSPAILAGNPAAPGRRFTLLAFAPGGKPAAVVKVGLNETARRLVAREATFLAALPRSLPGVPRVRGSFQSSRLQLLAQDFFPGDSPRTCDPQIIGTLLSSWLGKEKSAALSGLPAWRRLEKACGQEPLFTRLAARLAGQLVRPALYHGDFAPWNVKVAPGDGRWTVLDWERGEADGIPTWDWFHYVIQNAILARRLAMKQLIGEVEALLGGKPFQAYAQRSGVRGVERELLLAYALYNLNVIRPAEGLEQAQGVLRAFAARWQVA